MLLRRGISGPDWRHGRPVQRFLVPLGTHAVQCSRDTHGQVSEQQKQAPRNDTATADLKMQSTKATKITKKNLVYLRVLSGSFSWLVVNAVHGI
jgi:hypothetical protein